MKNLVLLTLILFSFNAHAQYLSGIYSGKLVNDSTKKEQNYELALSEYRGKITGYAYTTFVVNDTFYYSIKRVKATRVNGALVVEDVKMLVNNFPESPAKRVKQTNTIPLNESQDTILSLNGTWQTNQTKEYYSLYGALDMQKDTDSTRSTLLAHLEELQLIPSRTAASVGPAIAQGKTPGNTKSSTTGVGGVAAVDTRSTVSTGTKTGTAKNSKTLSSVTSGTTGSNTSGAGSTTANSTVANTKSNNTTAATIGAGADTSEGTKSNEGSLSKKNNTRSNKKNTQTADPVAAVYIPYTERGVNVLQEMNIVSDSIVLSFYDNGVVDGDMISVYINNENVLTPTKLTEAATKKTIHLKSFTSDSVALILVAETMGTLPPNTGLLVVQDGAKRYEVRFSADMQTNAALVLRKRK